ncbi:TonB-dependent receptor plug domain-containing protein [Pseudomarimonas arenosa]|uniref:TonB-dependent receptor n=1 Tax=Pseudomarimonas arenosa TaxID=2774145 RepID=A0AAW3ZI62_9GAMM|nr:TonB-dependent receptor [Pseudomarimonas arenosa]MBD8524171.1 TonB-dependent receptor [Pseudomarimonas arenosa]
MYKPAVLATAIAFALHAAPLCAQTDEQTAEQAAELDVVIVTGTRVSNRSATYTAAPVDVIGVEQIERSGAPELNQALSINLPSFNFPRPGLADGTDTIRPATLRGLSPDQTLVLLNSKRRHTSSLVNINGTVGRGAAAVDLNTIPTAAVQTIEVLRDGASAQYGSDAISGVINVLLRRASEGGGATLTVGQRESEYTTPVTPPPAGATWSAPEQITRSVSDGATTTASMWKGFALGEAGYFTLSAEYKDQQRTERGGYDFRQQYPLVNGGFDIREANFDRFNAWFGEPEIEQKTVFANWGIDQSEGARLYGWASYQDRDAVSAGFYRRALDTRNVIEIYPDGFLPLIAPEVTDASAALGYEWNWGPWFMDTSLVFGRNEMAFTITNTLNASIGPSSRTEFDAGGFDYDQWVFNFSGVRSVDFDALASPLNIAAGLEARRESYSIFAGEPDSYRQGDALLPNGARPQAGSQVFPGFRPSNEVDEDRNAVGVYLDLEANLSEKLLGSAAIRAEDYSDFGSNVTGKLALRYDINDSFALRGSLQNGFRAPSPQQQYFTATSTNFINGIPFDITTFPPQDPAARALGAQPLDAEESINVSLGTVFRIADVTVTIDAYRIDVDDRIVLSENLTAGNVRDYLTSLGFIGIGGGRFFINGVDTETQGVDVVVNFPLDTADLGRFDFILSGNYNDTEVTRVPSTNELSSLDPAPTLFGRINVLSFEQGTPKDKIGASVNWKRERFGATLRATRYGEVLDPGTSEQFDFLMSPKTLVDLEGRIELGERSELALGAENIFDQYPDASPISRNTTGNTPFSNYSPFGRSGRLVYARLSFEF